MHECAAMIGPQARERGIGVAFAGCDEACFVRADHTRLKQVLINLLSNAIKYNTVAGTVTVDVGAGRCDTVRIGVRDSGEGLQPEKLTQLFQPFSLGQEAGAEQGTGIGLVVSKRLVEWMGGVIGVESELGRGSVFWIELQRAHTPWNTPHAAVEAAAPAEPGRSGRAATQTLLYVEDNPANLMLVEDIIARRPDIALRSMPDATRGVEQACAFRPDVILMDINLPGISGIEALALLAADPETAHIPVIALSANAIPRDISKGLQAGFFRYLTKPIKVPEFMATLDAAMDIAWETVLRAATGSKEEHP